jgi:hypothetical protein
VIKRMLNVSANALLNSFDRLNRPWGLTRRDKKLFGLVLSVWRPQRGRNRTVGLRRLLTEWRNCRCFYCFQKSRPSFASIAEHFAAYAFDNFPVERLLSAVERHFSRSRFCFARLPQSTVGCGENRSGNSFDPNLPSIGRRSVACIHDECSCIDKYSFLSQFDWNTTTNVFHRYCDLPRECFVALA